MELIQFMPVVFFSGLAFWKPNPVLFVLAGVCALFNGLNWYDAFGTHEGLAIGLMLITYCFVCWGFAFRYIFWRETD